mgnify:CR=1 FL=1
MVLPPCTDQGISPYQGLVMPFNYRSNYYKLYFIDNKAFFSNYCLNFLVNMIYIYQEYFMGIHYDYKSTKSAKLMEKQAKREKKLAEKKAKRLAKESSKKDKPKEKTLDTSKPITLDFLTNPNKE